MRISIGRAIDRLPVGRATALRLGLRVTARIDRSARAGSLAGGGGVPKRFQVVPAPRPILHEPPEPPQPEDAATIVANRYPGGSSRPTIFDIDLFEALNAEYAARPLVPDPRVNTASGMTDRGVKRLTRIHESIDLADKRVLEFGCGAGFEVWLMSHHLGADAYGVDIAERRSWAYLTDERTHLVMADIVVDRPFPADHFDRIISASVFEHVERPAATLAELHRILKPGGLARISANLYRGPMASHRYREVTFPFPHLLFDDSVFSEFYERRGGPPRGAAWVNRLGWTEYEELFRRTGFRLRSLWFTERDLDRPFYDRFKDVLSRYPEVDLTRDFFHVVVEKT